jgi:riboflavin kinase / FMN adenylyltransferase
LNIYNDINALPQFKNTVITIGSFDGLHVGHQEILQRVTTLAAQNDAESVVITFDPHPRLIVYPDDTAVQLLTDTAEKCRILARLGIKNVVLVRFDADFANQSPETYIADFLVARFNPSHIVIGYDHHFGKNRAGNLALLRQFATQYQYEVTEINKQAIDDIAISSTKIRTALAEGNIKNANQLLGRPFALTGTVVKGAQIGRTIGYPTANIAPDSRNMLVPSDGIYAATIFITEAENTENSVFKIENTKNITHRKGYICSLYIGNRPTLDDGKHQTIEAFIFDFDKDIYHQKVRIELVEKIRNDMKLDGLDALKAQIAIDNKAVLEAFLY